MEIIVDKEFKELIPPLIEEDRKALEESILKDGCRDAIVLWNNIIVDGHNRYEICKTHNIDFKTVSMSFASRNECKLWMIKNQLARRNLTTADRILLAQKQKPILEEMAKANQSEAGANFGRGMDNEKAFIRSDKSYLEGEFIKDFDDVIKEFDNIIEGKPLSERKQKQKPEKKPVHVQKEIAKLAGTSTGTVAKFEQIQKKKPELVESIRKHETSIDKAYNEIKAEEKKKEILEAEKSIHEQASEELKPILYIDDCTSHIPTEEYDLLLTDPPYSTDVDNIEEFVDDWLFDTLNNVKDTGFAYIFIGAYPEEVKAYLNAKIPDNISLCQLLVWTYKNTLGNNPKDRYKQNYQMCLFYRGVNAPDLDCPLTNEQWAVQEINAPDGRQGDRYHAWQKPMEIAERFVRHSTKPGMLVYDPFACTGTFLLAATKLGRRAYGFEINPDNAAIAFKRGCVQGE